MVNLTNPPSHERQLTQLATRQHGVVARDQLLNLGLGRGAIDARVRSGRLHVIHRGVYMVSRTRIGQRGHWLAAVLAYGDEALLSHGSAAALWGLMRGSGSVTDVTSWRGRPGRRGIRLHRSQVKPSERARRDGIPVTCPARTLLDVAEVVDSDRFARVFEEADRLGLLEMRVLEELCEAAEGRRGVTACRQMIAAATAPVTTRSTLEDRFARFCRERRLPAPTLNVVVLGFEVDALWPERRLIVELDGFAYHRHRGAFERDRARDATLQAAGYRVLRLTHRRITTEAETIVAELSRLLG